MQKQLNRTGTPVLGGDEGVCPPELSGVSAMVDWDPEGLLGGILLKTLCFFWTYIAE